MAASLLDWRITVQFSEKTIAVLGATGSVGTQALDVARSRGYAVDLISAGRNSTLAESLAREFGVRFVAMADEASARDLSVRLADTDIEVLAGEEGILDGIRASSANTVINSILGEAGLLPTLAVLGEGKRLALANKESLVIAGDIVMRLLKEKHAEIIPVDSEHSAIFQSLRSGRVSEIKRILLTASGGPFFGKTREELERVTLADTLAHPTWKMGKKITVDSATLMNKGFEIIEAAHLFSTPPERVEVLVHRESIMHSAVEYIDNTVIAELSVPDMRMCVQYAVDYPDRMVTASEELDLFKISSLTFRQPDEEAFPLLSLAKRAIMLGGGMPAVMNAADEVAVEAFLNERLSFVGISEVVCATVEDMISEARSAATVDELIAADRRAREIARSRIEKLKI
ncbi:MAG: 1-deoxy-D-xylulose-5-phosphate reductoisomerase [Clostridia bacterium]|nr:1-deoxy-D-xylulose-5-phosphate reductoisomerase [Clostridia bacterium]